MIVPTLGTRVDFLAQSLQSIANQDTPADIVVVCPKEAIEARSLAERHHAIIMNDPGSLPKAINAGAAQLQKHHEFINWLGDDDLLEPGSLTAATQTLDRHPQALLLSVPVAILITTVTNCGSAEPASGRRASLYGDRT